MVRKGWEQNSFIYVGQGKTFLEKWHRELYKVRAPDTQESGERACQAEETEDAEDTEVRAGMVH